MKPDGYTVTEAARAVGVSEPTTRRWCKLFADTLSDGANPPPGAERRFSAHDIRLLAAAKQLVSDGLSLPIVAERLHDVTEAQMPPWERLEALTTVSTPVSDTVKARALVAKGMSQDVRSIADAATIMAANLETLSTATVNLAELRATLDALRASIDRLSERVGAVELAIANLPWYARPRKG